jgi:pimeloyl-ACP methyl ester carboxylesterase/class 3 adenylate cyclase/tetratricopeptide (TPR) repeat protein
MTGLALAFAFKVLGDFSVRRDGAVVVLPQSRKTRALLAYLSVIGKPQRRERLCELFWDVPDDPRGALRWSLAKLRPILNADGKMRLLADRNMVHLEPGSIDLDYDLVRGLVPEAIDALPTDRLEAIVAAFSGSFLSDLYFPRCAAFEAWRIYCANETEILRLKALRTLINRLADEPERALIHAHTLQSLLPDEDLGKEIAQISKRARRLVTAHGTKAVAQDPAQLPATEIVLAERHPNSRPAAPSINTNGKQHIRYTHARDGTRIAYSVTGSGPAIVRASHWMSHLEFDWESPVWGHWIEALSNGFTLVRYDGRLNGLSDTICQNISFEAFISDLECVIEAAGLDRFVLLGISQGCAFSAAYAVRHPQKVAGLVLYGGYARGWRARGDADEIERREAMSVLIRQGWGQGDPMFRQVFTNMFIPGASRDQMDWFNELQRRTLTPENAWRLTQALADVDISPLLEKLNVPAVVLHARGDRVTPASEGMEIARTIKGARFVELDSANHILLSDEAAFHSFVAEATAFASDVLQSRTVVPISHRTRRQATILSASFVSQLQSVEDLPPEVALEAVDPLLASATELVRMNGGIILNASENGLTAAFGAPKPLEDHSAFACRTALELRKLTSGQAGSKIGVCIALDTGNVIVSTAPEPDRAEVRGGPVSVAHTINQALRRDLVIATERTQASADGFVTMRELAPVMVPGFPKDQQLYEVIEINRGRSRWQLRAERQLSPFIGREMPLQMLNKAWHDTLSGEGQTVMIIGDPGLGKSRITQEFVGAIPQSEAENLETGALETYLRSGFLVIRKVLQQLFGVSDTEAAPAATKKVLAAWSARDLDQRLLDPILAVMELPTQEPLWTALSGPERSRRMQQAVIALLLSLSRTKPVVLLVEDLHWIDFESEAILARLAQTVSAARFMLILTFRPEYDRSVFTAAHPVEIRLSGLNPAESRALIDFLIGRDSQLDSLRGNLSEVCKGNALFLEETVRNLAETGKLEGQPGRYRLSGKVDEIVVSSNIHSIIDARFERLDNDAKHVAEIASIFGGDIPLLSLRRMASLTESRFDAALRVLKNADLLVEVQVFPDTSLRFKHGLIRNAISDRIISTALVELHKTALAELKACYADRLEEHSERLARHAQQAQLWEEAATYLLISAEKAIKRSAHAAALEQLDLGIDLLRSNNVADADNREIDFQLARGVALMAARGWGSTEVLAAFQRAEELCQKTGDRTRLFTALRGRVQYYMLSGKPAQAQELACRWVGLVNGHKDPGLAIETEHMFWTNNFFLGETATAHDHAECAIGLYEEERDHHLTFKYSGHDPGVCSRCFAGLTAWLAGEPDKAQQRCNEAVALAERLQHPMSMAVAHWGASHLHIFARQPERALQAAESEQQIAEEFQFPLLKGQAAFQIGWGRFWLGEKDNGLKGMDKAISAIRQTGAEMGLPYFIGLYAEALADCGSLDEARKTVEAALDLSRANGTYFQLADILRIKACIRERRGAAPEEVVQILNKAADIAVVQRSAIGGLRVATELARRLRKGRHGARARELMAPHVDLINRLGNVADACAAREIL